MPVVVIDLVVDRLACRSASLRRVAAVVGRQPASVAPARSRVITAGRSSSGKVKITEIGCIWVMTAIGVELPDLDVIAGVDLAQADAAGDRRDDAAIGEIELGIVDLRLVELDRAFVLIDDVDLILRLLACDRVLGRELLIAREIDARLVERRLVAQQLAGLLVERGLIGAGIDLRQEVALLDLLALLEGDRDDLARDLRLTVTVASGVTVPSAS